MQHVLDHLIRTLYIRTGVEGLLIISDYIQLYLISTILHWALYTTTVYIVHG